MKLKEIGNLIRDIKDGKDIAKSFDQMATWQQRVVMASKALGDAQKDNLIKSSAAAAAISAEGVAASSATAGVSSLGAALAATAASAKAFTIALLSNPITWIVGSVAAFGAALYAVNTSFDRSKEKANEARSEYEGTASELSSLNSELQTTSSRIQELQALKSAGTITLSEESELEKLQAQNLELERQISLKSYLQKQQQQESVETAMSTLRNKNVRVMDGAEEIATSYSGSTKVVRTDVLSAATQELSKLRALEKEREVLYAQFKNAPEGSEKDSLKAQIEENEKVISEYQKGLAERAADMQSLRDNFIDSSTGMVFGDLTSEQLAVYDQVERWLNDYSNKGLSKLEQNFANLESFFGASASRNSIKEYLTDIVKSGGDAEQALNGLGLSLDDIGVSGVTGVADLQRYFEDLVKSASEAAKAVDFVDGTMSGVGNALESANKGDNFVKFSEYLTQAKELYDKGLTGTDDFKTVAALINDDVEASGKEIKTNSKKFMENYNKLRRYITEDKDGNLTKTGIDRFAKDLADKLDKAGGSFENTAEAANKLGISTEVLEMLFGRMEDYDLSSFSKPIQELVKNLPRSAKALSEAKSGISELQKLYDSMDSGESRTELGLKLDKWKEQIDSAEKDLDSFDTDLVLEIKAELDLAQIQEKIDEAQRLVNEGGTVENYASLNASKSLYRSTAEKAVGFDKLPVEKIPVEYTFTSNAITTLQEQLNGIRDESVKMQVQAEISNLYDLQNNLLDSLKNAHPEITALLETDPSQAQEVIDEWISSVEGQEILTEVNVNTNFALAAIAELLNMDLEDLNISVGVSGEEAVYAEIDKVAKQLDQFRDKDGNVDLSIEGAEAVQNKLAALLTQKQQLSAPAIMSIDVSKADADAQHTLYTLQEIQSYANEMEIELAIGADPSQTQQKISAAAAQVDPEILAKLNIDPSEFNAQINALTAQDATVKANVQVTGESLAALYSQISSISTEAYVSVGVEDAAVQAYMATEKKSYGTTEWSNDTSAVDDWAAITKTANGIVTWTNDTRYVKTSFYAIGIIKQNNGGSGITPFNGTAHSQGTILSAYAAGNWGLKKNETALINELGKELVVRNGKAFTLNNGYPTFARLKKGDIIFNHLQTEELLKKGYVTNSHARVFGSYASGTVDKISNAYASGSDDKQTVDWVERLLEKLERSIKRLQVVAESAFKTLKERTKSNNNQIKQTASEIKYQQKSYDAYIKKANSVKLSSDLKKKVRDGSLNVKDYKGKTADLITEYKEFYDKAQDCKDAIQELHESLAQLYQDNFDNLAKDYSNQLDQLESRAKLYEEYITQSEARSYIGSVKYYEKLYSIEQDNISLLKKELKDLQQSQKQALDSGEIDKNSEAYYQMQSEINNVQLAIQESTTALLEYSNAMRELKWEYFDYEQERISALNDEAEFLVDLLSRSDLYDDKGNLTDEGNAVMGLHGQAYNTYMAQADAYATEIKKINEEIANDPNNTALLERRQELLELQRESILAAEDEKDAMVELVEQGIEAQLDSMRELIDSYTDALDNAKDLYDYQKKVADQTSEIASLQKQLSAYENNTSEEARAKVQQIKVKLEKAQSDLEEAQYDKYVSDQKALLDDLYDEYEQALNQRLDNVDALISELIDGVNANSSTINDTLVSAADEVGYTMTSEMQSIWNSTNDVLRVYGDDFSGQLTSVNSALTSISNSVDQLVKSSDERYSKDVKKTVAMNATVGKPNSSSSSSDKNTSSSSGQSSSSSNVFIKKKYNGNKSKLDKENSVVDRLKYFDFDASMSARKQYYKKLGLGSDYSGTASQNAKLLKKMKSIGYSKGGFVADLQKIAVSNGDDIITINTLKRGEAVLTPEQAAQFKKLVSYFPDISEFIDFSKYISNIPIDSIGTQIGDISIAPYFNILIDRVEDYNDFVTKLQHDKQFEKMIRSMSVDLLAGGNTLAKNKFKWH